jgi:hypothetical protein
MLANIHDASPTTNPPSVPHRGQTHKSSIPIGYFAKWVVRFGGSALGHMADIFSTQRDPIISPAALTAMYSIATVLALSEVILEFVHWKLVAGDGGLELQAEGDAKVDDHCVGRGVRR